MSELRADAPGKRKRLLAMLALAVGLVVVRSQMAPSSDQDTVVGAVASRPASKAAGVGASTEAWQDELCVSNAPLPQRSAWTAAMLADPFHREVVRVVAPPPRPLNVPVRPVGPVAPPPPPPLVLPYRLLGRLDEGVGPPVVYLSLGGNLVVAKAGDTLEGGFRLDQISRRELVFTHLERNQTLRLPIDGDAQ